MHNFHLLQTFPSLQFISFSCHWVSLFAANGTIQGEGRVHETENEGRASGVLQPSFRVPYDTLLPKKEQLTNLLVPVACSSSHVRFNAIRMEPVWMVRCAMFSTMLRFFLNQFDIFR